MPKLLFDLLQPPAEPPSGAHQLIWQLSIALRDDHATLDPEGLCRACGEQAPCTNAVVALKGLLLAMGHETTS